ncbi:TOM7 [Candida oxycetoniae]|uniref:TOM7 n=1 Tax=Candida oxycetoniae TaxID=497107 RepID=A0AAI9WZV7_9ASCO|nr:TOM7 [Candida oxycetoniae]KAI3406459.1 TOM7 [Candida oxycetoniae]
MSESSISKSSNFQLTLSDESKERIVRLLDYSKTIAHYGFIPLVLYLGWSATSSKPSILNLLSPFPSA